MEAVPWSGQTAAATAARSGPEPDAHGRGPRRLAQLPQSAGAKPAPCHRSDPATPGRGLRHRYPQPLVRPRGRWRARSDRGVRGSAVPRPRRWREARSRRWRRTRRASPTPSCDSTAPSPTAAGWRISARCLGLRMAPRASPSRPPTGCATTSRASATSFRSSTRPARRWRGAARPSRKGSPSPARQRLADLHGIQVRIVPLELLPDSVRRYDHHRRRLMLSELLGEQGRTFRVAYQLGLAEHDAVTVGDGGARCARRLR